MKYWYSPIGETVYVTQYFGQNPAIYKPMGIAGHNGLDFRTMLPDSPKGYRYTYSVDDGVVLWAKTNGGYGKEVRLRLDSGEEISYGHHHSFKVKEGQRVKGGQILGITDNTGFSSAPHLHFGVRPKNYKENGYAGWVNPMVSAETGKSYLCHGALDPQGRLMKWQGNVMVYAEEDCRSCCPLHCKKK